MSLSGPVDGERAERPAGDDVGEIVDSGVAPRQLIDAFDGGVSRRLVRRCRTAATIQLVIGGALLLVVAVVPWGVISALMTLAAGAAIIGSVLLLRRSALWSAVARSFLPGVMLDAADGDVPQEPAQSGPDGSLLPGVMARSAGTEVPREPSGFAGSSRAVFGTTATIGRPRPMSPGVASAPVRRRLRSAVVPIYTDDGPAPGGGGLIVHARADGTALTDGDKVLVWLAGHDGLTSLATSASNGRSAPSARGRFVLYRDTDNSVFLATTWLTDTW